MTQFLSRLFTVSFLSIHYQSSCRTVNDQQRQTANKYVRNYDFSYQLPPPLGGRGDADFTVTAVLGHLTSHVSALELFNPHASLTDSMIGLWG